MESSSRPSRPTAFARSPQSGRDPSIDDALEKMQAAVEQTGRRCGEFIDAWHALMPADLVSRTRLDTYRGGVAHLTVDSAATAYEIDCRLRSGMEGELRRRLRGTFQRVRTTIGPVPVSENS